jgi:uncharacterized protein
MSQGGVMKAIRRACICCVAFGLAPSIAWAIDGDGAPAPLPDKPSQKVLQAMRESSTEGHPDLHGQFQGILRYEKGDYAGAMKYFLVGARYADKVSQLSIGLLYLNGQGVAKDPATAYAWIALSAERNYPQFVATRDSILAQLNPQQRAQGSDILKPLMAEYGDAVAKPRLIAQLQQEKLHMTGSSLGFDDSLAAYTLAQFSSQLTWGAAGLDPGDPMPRCDLGAVEGGVITGCGDFWADNRWNSAAYFKATDRLWSGTVKVGPLQTVRNRSTPTPLSTSPIPSTDQTQEGTHP